MRRAALVAGVTLLALSAVADDVQLISDPGFENTTAGAICTVKKPVSCMVVSSPALLFGSPLFFPHNGANYLSLGGHGTRGRDFLIEQVTIPAAAKTTTLKFYLRVVTRETSPASRDELIVEVRNEDDVPLETLAVYSNLDASADYIERVFYLGGYNGQTIRIAFTAKEDSSQPTWFLLDDLTLTASW